MPTFAGSASAATHPVGGSNLAPVLGDTLRACPFFWHITALYGLKGAGSATVHGRQRMP